MVSANLVADRALSRPSAVRSVSGPTRLRLADLLRITDQTTDEVLRGHYDHLVPPGGITEMTTAGSLGCTVTMNWTSG